MHSRTLVRLSEFTVARDGVIHLDNICSNAVNFPPPSQRRRALQFFVDLLRKLLKKLYSVQVQGNDLCISTWIHVDVAANYGICTPLD